MTLTTYKDTMIPTSTKKSTSTRINNGK